MYNQLIINQNYPFPEYSKKDPVPTEVTELHLLNLLHDISLQRTFFEPQLVTLLKDFPFVTQVHLCVCHFQQSFSDKLKKMKLGEGLCLSLAASELF